MSRQAVKVPRLHGNAAYQTASSLRWPAVKLSWLLGMMLCAWEQACRACRMTPPTESSLFCCTHLTLLLLHLSVERYPNWPATPGDCPRSVSLHKARSCTQPPGVFSVLMASQAQMLEQLRLSPKSWGLPLSRLSLEF